MEETDYDDLVQQYQDGKIDDLQFLLAQEDLAQEFLKDMKEQGKIPTSELASKWLNVFENTLNL